MPCYHPLSAWRTREGKISLRPVPHLDRLRLPCGGCIGCRTANARAWAFRCHLELAQHRTAVFSTLTYRDETLPVTLQIRHPQLWLKRLRKALGPTRPIRFFLCGEYGEQTHRPHYHAILYGLSELDRHIIEETWQLGNTRTEAATPARIAYCAGYSAKKIGWKLERGERIDPETGEVYEWQPPFTTMSRRPGIGGHARQWPQSWRLYAIHQGKRMPVPRFLHEAWKQIASPQEVDRLLREKAKIALTRNTTDDTIRAGEQIAIAKQALQANKRKY